MIVVADASPLRYLILIDHAHVLPALYGHVLIPPAVSSELNQERTPAMVRDWLVRKPAWLEVRAPQHPLSELAALLGKGELEAIALAANSGLTPCCLTTGPRGRKLSAAI